MKTIYGEFSEEELRKDIKDTSPWASDAQVELAIKILSEGFIPVTLINPQIKKSETEYPRKWNKRHGTGCANCHEPWEDQRPYEVQELMTGKGVMLCGKCLQACKDTGIPHKKPFLRSVEIFIGAAS